MIYFFIIRTTKKKKGTLQREIAGSLQIEMGIHILHQPAVIYHVRLGVGSNVQYL